MKTIKTMLDMINKTFSKILSKMTNKLSKMLGFSKSTVKMLLLSFVLLLIAFSMRYFYKRSREGLDEDEDEDEEEVEEEEEDDAEEKKKDKKKKSSSNSDENMKDFLKSISDEVDKTLKETNNLNDDDDDATSEVDSEDQLVSDDLLNIPELDEDLLDVNEEFSNYYPVTERMNIKPSKSSK